MIAKALEAATLAAMIAIGASGIGCSSTSAVEARTTTTGQELLDLQEALDQGLITEDEYNKKREEILKRK